MDHTPRVLSQGQIAALRTLSQHVMTLLEMRSEVSSLVRSLVESQEKCKELEARLNTQR